jgi:hypothetical protein
LALEVFGFAGGSAAHHANRQFQHFNVLCCCSAAAAAAVAAKQTPFPFPAPSIFALEDLVLPVAVLCSMPTASFNSRMFRAVFLLLLPPFLLFIADALPLPSSLNLWSWRFWIRWGQCCAAGQQQVPACAGRATAACGGNRGQLAMDVWRDC